MAHYLTIVEIATECEGCAVALSPGLIGLTDEIHGSGQLAPLCRRCVIALDRRLGMAWIASIAGLDLDTFDRIVERLLELPEFAQWAATDERD